MDEGPTVGLMGDPVPHDPRAARKVRPSPSPSFPHSFPHSFPPAPSPFSALTPALTRQEVYQRGSGAAARPGQTAVAHYTAWLTTPKGTGGARSGIDIGAIMAKPDAPQTQPKQFDSR